MSERCGPVKVTPPFAIRRVLPDDLPAYKTLRDAMLLRHPTAFTSDAETERNRTPESYRPRLGLDDVAGAVFTIGAWRHDTSAAASSLLGAISCERDERVKVRHIGHLTGMMVVDGAQGLGIGKALLDEAIRRARAAQGLLMLTLSVTSDNQVALRLYACAGFIRYASLPNAVCVDGSFHAKDQMVLTL